ncbi:MAG: DUF1932 domain-containing protein [Celeribacter sp.]|jgi:3-hydroxyisobutyrate dehydrogenase-like beta-hydroxyacid dehydrogenase
MDDADRPGAPRLLVVGYGAAGRAYAEAFAAAGAAVCAVDPQADPAAITRAQTQSVTLDTALPATVEQTDLVVVLTPAAASAAVLARLATLPGTCPILDLTSSAPDAMRAAADRIGSRFIDGTVLGAVGLSGVATPMILAGSMAPQAAALLGPLGCRVTCLDHAAPGAASELKLLRSVFMKGLEALFVELKLCAATLDHDDQLRLMLWDLGEVEMFGFLDEMLRTHPRHAERRLHEVEAAGAMIAARGLATPMTEATQTLFARSAAGAQTGAGGTGGGSIDAASSPCPDADPASALDWLLRRAATVAA